VDILQFVGRRSKHDEQIKANDADDKCPDEKSIFTLRAIIAKYETQIVKVMDICVTSFCFADKLATV
jgi:hypothetical protein